MIQNRMTIVTSAQPASSKWCCSGAIRNTRLPVSLNEPTWMTTESVISDEQARRGAPAAARCAYTMASPASAPPSASDPVSPMKIFAGAAFHHRNPKQAPRTAAATTARSSGSRTS